MGAREKSEREMRIEAAADAYRLFMEAVGLPLNEDTEDTPRRVAKMFVEEFCSFQAEPPRIAKFRRNGYDQYIVQRGIRFSSICEHHHLPFYGVVHIGYQPKEWIIGLSKLARIVRYFAARPQLQERLVCDIAEFLRKELDPIGVIVVAEAEHMCMKCRGVRDPEAKTLTSRISAFPYSALDKTEMLRLMGY